MLRDRLIRAHQRSVPAVAITTADPWATVRAAYNGLNETSDGGTLLAVEWDVVRGTRGVGKTGKTWVEKALAEVSDPTYGSADPTVMQPVGFLQLIEGLPAGAVAFFHNAHRCLRDSPEAAAVVQAVANLRDRFKVDNRMLVLLAPDLLLPVELQDDVLVFDEPLPTGEELGRIIDSLQAHDGESVRSLSIGENKRARAIDFVTGLSAFAAEQVLALAVGWRDDELTLDLDLVRDLRRRNIEQTPGLSIYKGTETYEDIGGVEYAKSFFGRVLASRQAPRTIVYIDEIEKALAGAAGRGGDTSGVSQDILATLLGFMEDSRCNGTLCFGPPGCSKSLIAKATGNQGGIDTIQLDLGALKGSLVGESERNVRRALKVIQASSAGRSYWIATCNAVEPLPGALLRRFTHGILFFDLPQEAERRAIWRVHTEAFGLRDEQLDPMPDDRDWTGADVRNCCELAHQFDVGVAEAASHLLPVAVSHPDLIRALRQEADGRYKSAYTGEVYSHLRPGAAGGRSIRAQRQPVLVGPDILKDNPKKGE